MTSTTLRESVDLREWDSLVEDQGTLGSCTGNAIANAYELQVKQKYPDKFVELSRLFVYYNTRLLEGTSSIDIGATLSNSIYSVQQFGICSEQLWPYDISKFNVAPTESCYKDGIARKIVNPQFLKTIDDALQILNLNKPVVLGINVYYDFLFLDSESSVIPFPEYYDVGNGHAMAIVGYNLRTKKFLAKNSFGNQWGDNGYCWVPFDYLSHEVIEMWSFDITDQSSTFLTG